MPLPYYDLAVSQNLLDPQTQRERVAAAVKFGWNTVAIVHQAAAKLTEQQDRCPIRAVELEALLSAMQGVREALTTAQRRLGQPQLPNLYTVRQLTRINIPADDPAMAQAACSGTLARGYDIVAVQPASERLLQLACSSLEVDLICLDLSRRLPYRLKPSSIQAALARGVHFEICYAPALRSPDLRRQLFANSLSLCRETRGRGVVVSSGARSYMELRGPQDVINLATLFGLTPQQAQAAVTSNPAALLQRAASRRAYRGVLSIRLRIADEAEAQDKLRDQQQQQQQQRRLRDRQQEGAASMDVDYQPLSFAKSTLASHRQVG